MSLSLEHSFGKAALWRLVVAAHTSAMKQVLKGPPREGVYPRVFPRK